MGWSGPAWSRAGQEAEVAPGGSLQVAHAPTRSAGYSITGKLPVNNWQPERVSVAAPQHNTRKAKYLPGYVPEGDSSLPYLQSTVLGACNR